MRLLTAIKLSGVLYLALALACTNPKNNKNNTLDFNQVKDSLQRVNRYLSKKESDHIDGYAERHGYKMIKTGTGLRYQITKTSNGELAKSGQYAKVNFKVSTLEGAECYSSKEKGPQEFLIDQDNVESGVHEGIKYMHVGEKAIFIIPPHLAHGLIGDQNKIPALTTIVYEIELLSLRENPKKSEQK